jgi:hypothetical protein
MALLGLTLAVAGLPAQDVKAYSSVLDRKIASYALFDGSVSIDVADGARLATKPADERTSANTSPRSRTSRTWKF